MFIKKTLLAITTAALIGLTACTNEVQTELKSFISTPADAMKVVEMIDSIVVADMTTEQEIEQIYLQYCNLDNNTRELVTNYEKLENYRAEITKLYHTETKKGDGMDRSKVNIGTYCFNQQCWNDEGVQALVDCGIDFIANASYDDRLLDLLDKYGVGAFVSGAFPGWYTGGVNNGNVGTASVSNPISAYEKSLAKFVDRPCIWGIDIGDEPWSADIPHFGEVIDYMHENLPDKLMYLNLMCASFGYNSDEHKINGEKIAPADAYVEYINNDYLCFDNYPYADGKEILPKRYSWFFAHMQHANNLCNEYDLDYWMVIQANSLHGDYMTEDQLRMQSSLCLAHGVRVISWACWNAGWYEFNISDAQGNLNEVYYRVQNINKEIDNISLVYSKYDNIETGCLGINPLKLYGIGKGDTRYPDAEFKIEEIENCSISEIKTNKNQLVVAGYFEKLQGEGSAIMFTNQTNYWGEENLEYIYWCGEDPVANVYFTVADPDAKVLAYYNGEAFEPEYLGNGEYKLRIENSDNVFVTID